MAKKRSRSTRVRVSGLKAFQMLVFLLFASVVAGVGAHLLRGSRADIVPGGPAQLYVTPSASSVEINQDVSIQVKLNTGGQTVNAVQADLTYPIDKLQFVSFTSSCSAPFDTKAQELQTPGVLKIACGSIAGFNNAAAVVSTVTFKALVSSTSASVAFSNTSTVVRASDTASILGSTVGSTVTFTSSPPTVTAVNPLTGSSLGGTTVTITGTNFSGTPVVKFGTANATGVTRNSATSLTAVTPANNPGIYTVSVTVGTQTATLNSAYAYADTTAPARPSAPTASNVTTTKATVNWTAVTDTGGSGLQGYRLYRGTTLLTPTPTSALSFNDSGLTTNTTYQYSVEAVDAAGNVSQRSPTLSVTTLKVGDINNDGRIDVVDLSRLLSKYASTGFTGPEDLNGDTKVDIFDLSVLLKNYGT